MEKLYKDVKSHDFWLKRYLQGGESNHNRFFEDRWRHKIINKYCKPSDIIDVGCGDIKFWNGKEVENYTGIDISEEIIRLNKLKRPKWNFIHSGGEILQPIKAEQVLCSEMLYHVMDDESYTNILRNLTLYSKKYIFLLTWTKNPIHELDLHKGHHYQKYRDFESYTPIFEVAGFKLIKKHQMPFWIDKGVKRAMWVFKKS